MRGFGYVFGLLTAVTLLAVGLLLLQPPGFGSAQGLFTAFWLMIAFAAVISFARELWRRKRLNLVRKRRRGAQRGAGKSMLRRARGNQSRFAVMPERERRVN